MDEMYEEEASFDGEYGEEVYGEEELSPEEQILADLSPEEKRVFDLVQHKLRMTDPVLKVLKEMKDAPTDAQVENFKQVTGDEVYFINLSEKENFVFRPIKRQEWRTLMANIAKLDEFKKSEAIVIKGVLHPKLSQINIGALSAGSIETLKEMILRASNFMSPEEAIRQVRKL